VPNAAPTPTAVSAEARPTWRTTGEARRILTDRAHLSQSLLTAVIVGTILCVINQLDVILAGQATTTTWIKIGITYLVPFCVANIGILIGSHRPSASGRRPETASTCHGPDERTDPDPADES
jgi:hypothetical protein